MKKFYLRLIIIITSLFFYAEGIRKCIKEGYQVRNLLLLNVLFFLLMHTD